MWSVHRDKLNILIESFYKEVEKLRDATIQVMVEILLIILSFIWYFSKRIDCWAFFNVLYSSVFVLIFTFFLSWKKISSVCIGCILCEIYIEPVNNLGDLHGARCNSWQTRKVSVINYGWCFIIQVGKSIFLGGHRKSERVNLLSGSSSSRLSW